MSPVSGVSDLVFSPYINWSEVKNDLVCMFFAVHAHKKISALSQERVGKSEKERE